MPTEDDLRGAAAELRLHAESARVLLDEVTRLATDELWTGPVADRFADELNHQRSQLRTAHGELIDTAKSLEDQADAIKEERERQAAAAEEARLQRLAESRQRQQPSAPPAPSSSRFQRFVR